jgi:hypothetical protein
MRKGKPRVTWGRKAVHPGIWERQAAEVPEVESQVSLPEIFF